MLMELRKDAVCRFELDSSPECLTEETWSLETQHDTFGQEEKILSRLTRFEDD